MRDLRANIEESHNEWLKVKWKEIINIASLKVLSELNLEQVMYRTVSVSAYTRMYIIIYVVISSVYTCIGVS